MSNQTLIPAGTMQTIQQNAATLFKDGYRAAVISEDTVVVFHLTRLNSHYQVNLEKLTCECESFSWHQCCKHVFGVAPLMIATARWYGHRLTEHLAYCKETSGTMAEQQKLRAYGDRLERANWELYAVHDEFFGEKGWTVPTKFEGFVPEVGEQAQEGQKAA